MLAENQLHRILNTIIIYYIVSNHPYLFKYLIAALFVFLLLVLKFRR